MPLTLEEISRAIGAQVIGDSSAEVASVASVKSAAKSDLVFVEGPERLDEALASQARAIIAGSFATDAHSAKPLLIAAEPRLAFTRAARLLHPPRRYPAGVHSTAVVHRSAKIGKHVSIGPNVVLGEDCVIGDGTRIGPSCCIANQVEIGKDCFIDNNVSIYSGTRLGNRVAVRSGTVLGSDGFGYVRDPATGRYEQFPQLGRLEIGDDVEIGANCTIDRGALDSTVVGRGVKIDNLVHLAHNVEVGDDVVIAALTGISGSSVIES
ncbi:MAG TPA: UDP-3-O-(3-hydroxymyristoyl)glucosamine N-acyltransferase, partial [Terriglobales bacterium]|nr:UDP-3-O-(3-hydroxymyristoyl)glucosamine N-acyltransferase [Terriglobales bacterium]